MKKKSTNIKKRNMVVYTMLQRYGNGRGAGSHQKPGYSRKIKHKNALKEY
jgi:hypothetical protein